MRFTLGHVVGALVGAVLLFHSPPRVQARIAFTESIEMSVNVGERAGPGAMALADVTQTDARVPDLLVIDGEDRFVEVFIGDEGFGTESDAEFELPDEDGIPVAVAAGNFDSSSTRVIDVAVLTRDPAVVRIFRNTPDPEDPENEDFDPERDFTRSDTALTVDGDPRMMVVGRFNNDTRDDIAVLTATSVQVFLSNGDANGTFQRLSAVSTSGSDGYQIIAAKLNDDEFDDVAITDPSAQQVKVLTANSSGALSFATQFNAGDEPRGITGADYDGDGDVDLLVADAAADFIAALNLFRGMGTGEFGEAEEVASPPLTIALVTFDVDRNGSLDAVAASLDDGEAASLLCQPSDFCDVLPVGEPPLEAGVFRQPRGGTIPNASGGEVAVVAGAVAGDDLFPDLIILSDDGMTATLMVNESTSGMTSPTVPPGITPTPTPTGPTPTPTVTRTATPTATTTGAPIPYGVCQTPVMGRPVAVAIGNFDGGGNDVAYADETGNEIGLLSSNRVSATEPCSLLNFSHRPSVAQVTGANFLLAADLDRNGKQDLVALGANSEVTLLLGNGAGTFTKTTLSTTRKPSSVAVADFNRDLNPDLIVADGTGRLSLYLASSPGVFGVACPINQGVLASVVATDESNGGDLNGDGYPDMVVGGSLSPTTSVLLRRRPSATPSPSATPTTAPCLTESDFTIITLEARAQALLTGQFEAPGNILPDIAVVDTTGTVLIFDGRPSGSSSGVAYSAARTIDQMTGITDLGSGNIFGLQRADLAYPVSSSSQVFVLKADGAGGYIKPIAGISVGAQPLAIAVGDVDGDGIGDTVTANSGGTISVLVSRLPPTPQPTPTPTPVTPTLTPTLGPSLTPTPSPSPSRTLSPTRTRTPGNTATPMPTKTERGVVFLSNDGCTMTTDPAAPLASAWWPLLIGLAMIRYRSRKQS